MYHPRNVDYKTDILLSIFICKDMEFLLLKRYWFLNLCRIIKIVYLKTSNSNLLDRVKNQWRQARTLTQVAVVPPSIRRTLNIKWIL